MAYPLLSKILSDNEISIMKEKISVLLSKKGVKIHHPGMIKLLKDAGAEILDSSVPAVVKFPISLIEDALNRVPKSFTLAAIDSRYDLHFPHPEGLFYTRTNTGGLNYYSEDGEYRYVTPDDTAAFTQLSQALENIDFCSLPSTSFREFPSGTSDVHTLSIVFQNMTKHVWVQPYGSSNIKHLIALASLMAGGRDKLKKRPIISMIACCNTPLEYKYMDMEAILQSCRYGIPIQACSLPTSGGNAPITAPAAVLAASAEVLAMVVMTQIIEPGTPVIATPLLFSLDMMSTATLQSSIETTMGRMAAMQLFEEGYGIPAHTYGAGTDSFITDGQAMIECTSTAQMVALSGASILGGAGQIETAKTISPIQLVIDNNILGMAKKLRKGLSVDDESLAWEELIESTGREQFLDTEHTFRHFREIYQPDTFVRISRNSWKEKDSKDMLLRATEIYNSLRTTFSPILISEELINEMRRIEAAADKET